MKDNSPLKANSGVLIICIILMGCSSSYVVSSSQNAEPSFKTFNVDVYDRMATIVFKDGGELDARNIVASPDSTRFLNDITGAMTAVPTHAIVKVLQTNRGTGFLEGIAWGAGAGVVAGLLTGLVASASSSGNTHAFGGADMADVTLALGAAGGGAGVVIGGIIGVSIGHRYEFGFPATADSANK
jgi:hypothetical protein